MPLACMLYKESYNSTNNFNQHNIETYTDIWLNFRLDLKAPIQKWKACNNQQVHYVVVSIMKQLNMKNHVQLRS